MNQRTKESDSETKNYNLYLKQDDFNFKKAKVLRIIYNQSYIMQF